MSEIIAPPNEALRQLAQPERDPSRLRQIGRYVGSTALVGLLLAGPFVERNQAVLRDLLALPFDKTDEVVFAIEGTDEPDHIRQHPTDDVAGRIAHVRSSADITDESGNLVNTLKNYADYGLNAAQPLEYVRFLHNFESHPQAELTSEKTGITYTVYSDEAEPLWQDYASPTFEDDLVSAVEYSLESHAYENDRVQFIQDSLIERTVEDQELADEHIRVFIPSEPSCLNSGVPVSLLDNPKRECDAFGAAPRDMSIRWLPFYSSTGFDNVIVLAGTRLHRDNANTHFEQLVTHEGIHRIHFSYGYEGSPHDQSAIEKNVKYVEYEIFGSLPGNRNYNHRPIDSTEPLINFTELYADYTDDQ